MPYQSKDDARWKAIGGGDRIEVTLMKPVGGMRGTAWFDTALKGTREYLLTNHSLTESEQYGLLHIPEKFEENFYDMTGKSLKIHCSKPDVVPFPRCKVKSQYREDLVLEYYYGLNFLPQWREIDNNLKKLFQQFS
ncbi:MAG: hypothetical protein ABL933_02890 [Methyloglobulus sp.]|nr:hypothetical protein [Methyloglobulus sp.]